MPVWWVEQRKGPHVSEIRSIVARFKAGDVEPEVAYRRLVELYRATHDGGFIGREWEDIKDDDWDVNHFIKVHFPFYANHWFSGPPGECEMARRRLEKQHPGSEFVVGYEY
jgi:hypothetical protein